MTIRATRNLHVPLPDPMYRQLRAEAQRTNRPATDLAREAIDRWLAERHRVSVHEAVAAYALENAASPMDLDEVLEAAGIESILAIDAESVPEQGE